MNARFHATAAVICLLLVIVVPFLLLGEGSYVLIHDNLDSEFVYLTNLVRSGTAFEYVTDAVVPNVMGGLPRTAMRSGFNLTVGLFAVFDPLPAYAVNSVLVRMLAFVGMLLLLRRHVVPGDEHRALAAWLALLFALLPYFSVYGASVAGQPLLLFAYANIARDRGRWWDWLIIALFPFYSMLYLSGVFILVLLGAFVVYRTVRERSVAWRELAPVLVLGAGYMLAEWPIIRAALFDGSWTSHRAEFVRTGGLTDVIHSAGSLVFEGQYHAATLPTLPIIIALALAWGWCRRTRKAGRTRESLAAGVAALVGLIVLFHAAYGPVVVRHFSGALPILGLVQFDRFYFLLPLCWFILFAVALAMLLRHSRLNRLVPLFVAAQAAVILFSATELRSNWSILFGREVAPSFGAFFSADLFDSVRDEIGRPQDEYGVVAVGLHPSILQYNGFNTLDGYQNNYPLAYKHRFRDVIQGELARSPELERYFDNWGSRCYVFSSELGLNFLWGKDSEARIERLSINVEALKKLGATYVLSSVPVENHQELAMESLGAFETPDSYWRIHLYELRE